MTRIGVLDRHSQLLPLVAEAARVAGLLGADVHDLGRPGAFGPATGGLDVLVLGPAETTPAGLRRVGRWRAEGGTDPERGDPWVIACVPEDTDPDALPGVDALVGRDGDGLHDALRSWATRSVVADPLPGAQAEPGLVLCVASASGGSGKTLLATNLAAHLAAGGHRVLLVDLDLQFGQVAAVVGVRPERTIYDGLYDETATPLPDSALGAQLEQLVHRHALGFHLLAAPPEPALAEDITGDDVRHVLHTVRHYYDLVVVDTPPTLSDVVLSALDQADLVAVLATLDVPSLRALTSFLDVLRRLGVDDRRLRLVLSKIAPDVGIEVSQAQDAFAGRFVGELPASRAAARSLNAGTVVLHSEPRSSLSRALVRAIEAVVPVESLPRLEGTRATAAPAADLDPPAHPGRPRRRLRSAFRRGSAATG